MAMRNCFLFLAIFSVIASIYASDPDMLQDICVVDLTSDITVNGYPCKTTFTADDFFFNGLATAGNTTNLMGSIPIFANVQTIPGLNTLGLSLARVDIAVGGIGPPHTHPRATDIVFVLDGTLHAGFITTGNVFFSKTITKGDVFVFPHGSVHFLKNSGSTPATVISAFNSQLPGRQSLALTLFTSTPPVSDDILAKAFQIDNYQVEGIKAKLAPKKN